MTKVTILGSGIIGLWTADILESAGHEVDILSQSGYANSTSAAAGCVMVPLFPGDPMSAEFQRSLRWAKETLQHMQSVDRDGKFLERMPCYEFGLSGMVEYSFPVSKLEYVDYFSTFDVINLGRLTAGCDIAIKFDCYLCNAGYYLEALHDSLIRRGVKFQFKRLESTAQLDECGSPYIFNCTGYSTIFRDSELYPVFGQSIYIPVANQQPSFFGLGAGEHSVFKHRRGFHVGAYFKQGEAGTGPRSDLYEQSFSFVNNAFRDLSHSVGITPPSIDMSKIERVNAGIRPFRKSGPRVEAERRGSMTVIHNYGHGAHGWTTGYGAAIEAVSLANLSWLESGEEGGSGDVLHT